jgi:hypothetical protein
VSSPVEIKDHQRAGFSRFGNGNRNSAPDDSAHGSTLAGGMTKHKRFLHKNFTNNPQNAIAYLSKVG